MPASNDTGIRAFSFGPNRPAHGTVNGSISCRGGNGALMGWRWLAVAGALVVVGGVAVVLLLRLRGGEDESRFVKPPPPLPAGMSPRDGLLLVRDQRLIYRNMRDGKEYTVKEAPRGSFYNYPRWSPDGSRIAYVIDTPPTGAPGQDWGSDLALSRPDGGDERIALRHSTPGMTITGVAWLPDGNTLLVGLAEPVTQDGRIVGRTTTVERLDLATGVRAPVIQDAVNPAVAPDGGRIAYIADGVGEQPAGLWTATPDGSDRRFLVPLTPDPAGLPTMLSPRFSPDGSRIAYAAADLTGGWTPPNAPPRRAFHLPWQPRVAAAHGLPMDIWLIAVNGGTPERLTHLGEDEPVPAWSPDGRQLAVIATGGLYLVPLGGDARRIGHGAFGGQLDWR